LSDKDLDEAEAYIVALKQRRDEERKAKAMLEAEAILAAAGIVWKGLNAKIKTPRKRRLHYLKGKSSLEVAK